MSQSGPSEKERPLSPHLQAYKPQMTSALSIFHRITGVSLVAGTLMVAWWLIAAATSEAAFNIVRDFSASPLGTFMFFGWSVALFYHTCNGIRHFLWDMGYLFKIENAYKAGYLVLLTTLVLTALAWFSAYSRAEIAPYPESEHQTCAQLCASYSETEKSFNGNRTCIELCMEEGACSLPHVSCPQETEPQSQDGEE